MSHLNHGNNEPSKGGPKANTKGNAKTAPKARAKAAGGPPNGHDKTEETRKKEAPVWFPDLDKDNVATLLNGKANEEGFIWSNNPNNETGYNGFGLYEDIGKPHGFSALHQGQLEQQDEMYKLVIETLNPSDREACGKTQTKKEKEEHRLRMKERISAWHRDQRYKLGEAMVEWWDTEHPYNPAQLASKAGR